MKLLILTILSIVAFSAFSNKEKSGKKYPLDCVLTCNKTTFKIGEVPMLEVKIKNDGNSDICLIGALEGSDDKRRMPYCYYTIEKPKPDTVRFTRCGNSNPLRAADFKIIKRNSTFNPFEHVDDYGFFTDYLSSQTETYRNPGIYKIQFHYSTNSDSIKKFMGNFGFWDKRDDSTLIKELFTKVTKVDLVSNTIEIKIVE